MDTIAPELLLHIFDLVVHTPDNYHSMFPSRTALQSVGGDEFRFATDKRYPDFPTGISAHAMSTQSPLSLSHVCRKWRGLAFAESQLWSTIFVTNGGRHFAHLFELWLGNSGCQPLSLVFRDGAMWEAGDAEVILDMFMLAAPHHQRWHSLKIRLRRIKLPMKKIAEFASLARLDNLKTLAFSFNTTYDLPDDDRFNAVWGRLVERSPMLEEMQMWSTVDYDIEFLRRIPFSRLRVMTLPMVRLFFNSSFATNLHQCSCLHTLSISLNMCLAHSVDPYTLPLPSLRNLDIISPQTDRVTTFMQMLQLPSLSSLSIHTDSRYSPKGRGRPLEWGWLKEALDHWKPRLLRLSIRDETALGFEPSFLPLLHHPSLQSLVELKVGGIVGQRFMEEMTIDICKPDSSPVRNLQYLHIESARIGDSQGLVSRMALSRRQQCSADLHEVKIDFCIESEMDDEEAAWDKCNDPLLQRIDRSFRCIGPEVKILDREFMVRDFSMIQGWTL
ncbi:hypothetical protein NMY22_g10340 [Coprinellus aureogranulatus]|nr:hypothetical protein NMY22_g10340 [Coprinellus aureogranulatus]